MTVSPKRQARKPVSQNRAPKTARQNWMKRMLHLEALEPRQLMAGDLQFHNFVVPTDVNGDSTITPLDALVVINKLNTQGSGPLSGVEGPKNLNSFVDVDGDNSLSPLDALRVINAINNGEGLGEKAEVKYEFYSVKADGTADTLLPDPSPDNLQPDATISPGQKVIIRTLMTDLRRDTPPRGVFSAYHDLTYKNADGSAAEKLLFQWGEFNQLDIGGTARSGTFTLRYGPRASDETAPISIALSSGFPDSVATAANIRAAIEGLSSVGPGNVKVVALNGGTLQFGINFIGSLARTDFVDPMIGSNNVVNSQGAAVAMTITGQSNPAPTQDSVARVARNHDLNNDTVPNEGVTKYINGPSGVLIQPTDPASRTLTLLGGFSNSSTFLPTAVATRFLKIVDVLFVGGSVGKIDLAGTVSPPPTSGQGGNNLGIALFGEDGGRAAYLTSAEVVLPRGSITILDKLTAVIDTATIAEDSAQTSINVLANDIDLTGSSRSITSVTQPSQGGTVTFNSPNVSFTPSKDFNGVAVFTYTVTNNVGDSAVGTVSITVTPVNDPPVVINSQFSVAEDPIGPLVITPTQIFSPGPPDESLQTITLSNILVTGQTNGTVTLVDGNINFFPAANFFGTAVFQVTGTDTGTPADPARSIVATITVNVTPVNDAPVPFSGTLTVAEDSSLILIGTGAPTDLITNSNPGPGESSIQTVSFVSAQSPTAAGGTITTVGGITTYRPAPNFFGTDTFTYRITDNAIPPLTADGTVTVNVTAVNDAPVAVNDTGDAARFVVLGIAAPNSLDVMRNDSAGPLEPKDITVVSVTTPTIGTTSVAPNGGSVIFTPPTGLFNVTSTFSYTIRDAGGLTSTANVEVFIIPPVLPFALTDTPIIAEDSGAFTIDVLANDFANTDAIKSLVSFGQPAAGTGTVVLDDRGTTADTTDDRVIYTPAANFFGDATFVYTMTDSAEGSAASTATVTVTVTPVNDPPVAIDRSVDGTEDIVLTVASATITDGLSKGPGEDAQTLTITDAVLVSPSNSGSIAVVAGNIVYSPALDFNGQVLVRYTVTDNGLNNLTPAPLSASATLTINVAPVNDPPVANPDPVTVTAENSAVTIAISSLLANDTPGPANESSQTVSFTGLEFAINTANGGTVTQVGGNLIYTPAPSFNGPDSFTYQINDGQALNSTTTATATLRITEVNDAPRPTTLSREVYASVPTIFNLADDLAAMPKGPANENGQTLRVLSIGTPTIGTAVLNANGTITYTAPLGESGRATFTYEVIDDGTTNGVADPKSATGIFNVEISPFIPSSVRGVVYIDDNGSGVVDPVELKIGGVEVTLSIAATATTPATTKTEMTLADGSFVFDLLPPGSYTVSYVVPAMMDDAPGPNSYRTEVVAPGDINVVHNFAVSGVKSNYANLLEYMSSSFDSSNPRNRNAGVYAAIGASGRTEWTVARTSFEADTFQEVVMSDDGTQAYLTSVRGADHSIYTATLSRKQWVQVVDPSTGVRLVRVLARSEDLTFQKVSLAAPPATIKAKAYLDTVDDVFAEQGWSN
jgi:hypothetical protein